MQYVPNLRSTYKLEFRLLKDDGDSSKCLVFCTNSSLSQKQEMNDTAHATGLTLHNVCAVHQGVCSTPGDVQYTVGYHLSTPGGVQYTEVSIQIQLFSKDLPPHLS